MADPRIRIRFRALSLVTEEQQILNRIRALSSGQAEYVLRLRQALAIAQVGGIDDATLDELLRAAVMRGTPYRVIAGDPNGRHTHLTSSGVVDHEGPCDVDGAGHA